MASCVWHTCRKSCLVSPFSFYFNVVCKILVDRPKNYFYVKTNLLSALSSVTARSLFKTFLFLIPAERQKCCSSDASHFEMSVQFSSAFRHLVGISSWVYDV